MPVFNDMLAGARLLADMHTDVKPGEEVLILIDRGRSFRIAEAASEAVRQRKGIPVTVLMDILPVPNTEPPSTVAAAMERSHVVLGFLSKSIFHTQARLAATRRGMRMISATGIVEETLTRGLINADYVKIKPVVDDLGERLTSGRRIRITSPAGSDLTADIEGRCGNREIWSREPGQISGAPGIEVNVPPLEGSTEGRVVVDGSIAAMGIIREPITLTFEEGLLVNCRGGPQAPQLIRLLESTKDSRSYAIAEIGIGLNPEGAITGNIIEDESTFGTAHIALGNNTAHGGRNPAPIHLDIVFLNPTIELYGEVIVKPGFPELPKCAR